MLLVVAGHVVVDFVLLFERDSWLLLAMTVTSAAWCVGRAKEGIVLGGSAGEVLVGHRNTII